MLAGLDLFSGIGGISLGLKEWVKPIAYCECDRYAQGVLRSRFRDGCLSEAPIFDDVRRLDGKQFIGQVDIIYGGFPCQDISVAGNGVGLGGERSGLFSEIMRLAQEIKPKFIFLENVPAIRTRGLDHVAEWLACAGYDCRWDFVSAEEVGAPHRRQRWFLLAHSNRVRRGKKSVSKRRSKDTPIIRNDCEKLGNSNGERLEGTEHTKAAWRTLSELRFASLDQWPQGLPKPAICRGDDGLQDRARRLRCLGNAVVPLQVKTAFERLIGVNKCSPK